MAVIWFQLHIFFQVLDEFVKAAMGRLSTPVSLPLHPCRSSIQGIYLKLDESAVLRAQEDLQYG